MSFSNDDSGERAGSRGGEPAPVRDLIDFFRRWPEFRQTAERLADRSDLSPHERQTVHWLILLVDRIGEHDLQSPRRS